MAIWLRAREEFADNHFQLLFIYIDICTLHALYVISYYNFIYCTDIINTVVQYIIIYIIIIVMSLNIYSA